MKRKKTSKLVSQAPKNHYLKLEKPRNYSKFEAAKSTAILSKGKPIKTSPELLLMDDNIYSWKNNFSINENLFLRVCYIPRVFHSEKYFTAHCVLHEHTVYINQETVIKPFITLRGRLLNFSLHYRF